MFTVAISSTGSPHHSQVTICNNMPDVQIFKKLEALSVRECIICKLFTANKKKIN